MPSTTSWSASAIEATQQPTQNDATCINELFIFKYLYLTGVKLDTGLEMFSDGAKPPAL